MTQRPGHMDGFIYLMIKMTSRSEIQSTLVLEKAGPAVSGKMGVDYEPALTFSGLASLSNLSHNFTKYRVWGCCALSSSMGWCAQGCWTRGAMAMCGKQLVGIGLSMHQAHKDGLPSGNVSEDGIEEGSNQTSDTQPHGCGPGQPALGGPA